MALEDQLLVIEDIMLKEIPVRDRETDEETTAWTIDHPELERPCRGDTPQEALEVFGECLGHDGNDSISIELEDLAEQ